jgi:hypothetical protein
MWGDARNSYNFPSRRAAALRVSHPSRSDDRTQVSNESLSGCGEIGDLDGPPEMSSTCLRFGLLVIADKNGVWRG